MRLWDSRWGCEVGGVYTDEDGGHRVVVTSAGPNHVYYSPLGSHATQGAMIGPGAQQRFRAAFKVWSGKMRFQGVWRLLERERLARGRDRRDVDALQRERNIYEGVLRRMSTAGPLEPGDEITDAYLSCEGDPYEKLQAMAQAALDYVQRTR